MSRKLWARLLGGRLLRERLNSRAASLYELGRYEEAIERAARSVELTREAVGAQHPDLATALNHLARAHRAIGNYAAAEPLFLEAIEIRRVALGETHPDFAQGINNLALLYDLAGEFTKAEPLYRQAMEVARVALGETHPDYATTVSNLATLYGSMGEYSRAELLLREALETIGAALGEEHPRFATILDNLAALHYRRGHYAAAVQPCRTAMEIRRAALGERHPDFAGSLNNLAQLHEAMGNYAAAEPYLLQSMEIVRATLGEAHPDFALALSNLATHHHSRGEHAAAQPLFERALGIRRAALGKTHPDFATSLAKLAMLHVSMGDCMTAEPLLREALELTETALGASHPDVAARAGDLASLYLAQGNYAEAERFLRRAAEVRRAALGETHPDFATSLTQLASFYRQAGNYAAAGPLSLQAVEIKRASLGGAHPELAQALDNLALLYDEMGEYEAAEPLFEQALEIVRSSLGKAHPQYATSLNNLALSYISTRNHDAAAPLLAEAVEVLCSALGERHPDFAASLSNLGLLHQAMGDHVAAEPLFERAAAIVRGTFGERHPSLATMLTALACSLAATGRVAGARALIEQALAIQDTLLGEVFAMSSEDQRRAYLDRMRIDHDRFLSLVSQHLSHSPEAVRAAFSLALRRKGITAAAAAIQRDALSAGKEADAGPRLRELATLRAQIARKALDGAGTEGERAHQRMLAEWNARREVLEGELARLVPGMKLEQELRAVDPRAVAMAMPEGATLIELVSFFVADFDAVAARGERDWGPARYLAFVMSAGEPENVRMIDLGDAEKIDRMIAIFRSRILAVREADEAGMRLREAVFAPLRTALGDVKRLLIAPDVDLALLPFEVLPLDDGRRLIDEYHVTYLSAGRDVLRFEDASKRVPARPLVVADPDFDLSIEAVDGALATAGRRSLDFKSMGMYFDRLLGTRVEGERIAAMLDAELWTDGAALEGRLKQYRSPRILHVATHGLFVEDAARDPYEARSRFDAMSASAGGVYGAGENPLLRCGLVLAGFNTWLQRGELMGEAEDGLLTAEDAAGLDLLGTELVVLSACETGLGDLSVGEGVFGLRRSFVLAGARTLVMSLWKVPDEQTQELMEDFYRRMLGTDREPPQPRSAALRAAQLAMKARHPHPFYWGAFIYQGFDGVLRE